MPVKPDFGAAGGQQYDVARAIRSFLGQMAEGGIKIGSAVIKELLQNADDAGATEVALVLDERTPPATIAPEYRSLVGPALIVRNNAKFKVHDEVPKDDQDDFTAICDVAGGHKRHNATAAGRFGIGFNSVYFLTDTPLLFSRREVHIFDLLHQIFDVNGWRFPLEDFPSAGLRGGPIKTALEWVLPKSVLQSDSSFAELAINSLDYRQTVLRLPLRQSEEREPALYQDYFRSIEDRLQLLKRMWNQAARSVLFLKRINRIVFGVLYDRQIEELGYIEITPNPAEFDNFIKGVKEQSEYFKPGQSLQTGPYERSISKLWRDDAQDGAKSQVADWQSVSFLVMHSAPFDSPELAQQRKKLHDNGERAVPWVSLAIPRTQASFGFDKESPPAWRVFLPLIEKGPCAAILNAAFFVGPSRQRVENRSDGSDESLRKTNWNKLLLEQALVPLLRNISSELIDHIPDIVEKNPKEYLSLFPVIPDRDSVSVSLSEYFQHQFSKEMWILWVYDIWGKPLELFVGDSETSGTIEKVPEWLSNYRSRFDGLSTSERRFLRKAVGDAISDRLGESSGIKISDSVGSDVARAVLISDQAPQAKDIVRLLKLLNKSDLTKSGLQGLWCLQKLGGDTLRFDADTLYLLENENSPQSIHRVLKELGLSFERTDWVEPGTGLAALDSSARHELDNLVPADDQSALELLTRVGGDNRHDVFHDHRRIEPVVDFLCKQSPHHLPENLRLGFLIKTANSKETRRRLGVIFLKPDTPTDDDKTIWEGFVRGVFAEVDPNFASCVHLLLAHAHGMRMCLNSADCRVEIAHAWQILPILHHMRINFPGFCEIIGKELNRPLTSKEGSGLRPEAQRAARLLIEAADRNWETLPDELRITVLALPIHRTPDGQLVSLIHEDEIEGFSDDGFQERFRLQSEDDLQDAPITLPDCTLLHNPDRSIYRFYKRLGIEEHGRKAILKECLRQIGSDGVISKVLLEYIAKHYVNVLDGLGEDDLARSEASEIKQRFAEARTVPCTDDQWRQPTGCLDAKDVSQLLKKQGWQKDEPARLLEKLAWPSYVASLERGLDVTIRRLHSLERFEPHTIPLRALTNEHSDFLLRERVKLIVDNHNDLPRSLPGRAIILNSVSCTTLVGKTSLHSLEWIDLSRLNLGVHLARRFFPDACDLPAMADHLHQPVDLMPIILETLGVAQLDQKGCEHRIREKFSDTWGLLTDSEKIELLAYIGLKGMAKSLRDQVATLAVVRDRRSQWTLPNQVVSPWWQKTTPPQLLPDQQCSTKGVSPDVLSVWEEWCGLRNLDEVVQIVVVAVNRVPASIQQEASIQLYNWLERVASLDEIEPSTLAGALEGLPWVLARKGGERQFHMASETIFHPGAEVLARRFWVVDMELHPQARKRPKDYKFLLTPPASLESIAGLVDCLCNSTDAPPETVCKVYELVADIIENDDNLKKAWAHQAETNLVFRLFCDPEMRVYSYQLFLGKKKQQSFGNVLFCLAASKDVPKEVSEIYRKLGVPVVPSTEQIVAALSNLSGTSQEQEDVHARLVDVFLERVTLDHGVTLDQARSMKVLSCSSNYRPIASCYQGGELNERSLLSEESRDYVIDESDKSTMRLIEWLHDALSGAVQSVQEVGNPRLSAIPHEVALSRSASIVIGEWESWFHQLADEDSQLRQRVIDKLGIVPPATPFRLVVVEKVVISYVMPDGIIIEPSNDWEGLRAFQDGKDCVFIRRNLVDQDFVRHPQRLKEFDDQVAEQVGRLLESHGCVIEPSHLLEFVVDTLERPGVVLSILRKEQQDHVFHQYQDQAADPEFASLFDRYQRTKVNAIGKRREIEKQMLEIIHKQLVKKRRDQIRGYGYDEFSIFAELVQNAEDAYVQLAVLDMDAPVSKCIRFAYQITGQDSKTLVVEHYGRLFNYWKHGTRAEEGFKRDVQGVLRSAGSFKPFVAGISDANQTIGRFGLGFKSVYLLTDRPRIHSGYWHFEIESASIPQEAAAPDDLPHTATRIVLPLIKDAVEKKDPTGEQMVDLMPFLREIDYFSLCNSDGTHLNLQAKIINTFAPENRIMVELVELSGAGFVKDGVIHILRIRHTDHPGQLAIYIGLDGIPARWKEVFQSDVFTVLPLKANLGCGVGVSHLFELQSGRTHLIDLTGNQVRFEQVASLTRGLPLALSHLADSGHSKQEITLGFWTLWSWDRGDEEMKALRQTLSRELVEIALRAEIVPTLDSEKCVALDGRPVFYFDGIPEEFAKELIQESITVPFDATLIPLRADNIIHAAFRAAYERICKAAKLPSSGYKRVAWEELRSVFQNRPWFAERPNLLSSMARTLREEDFEKVIEWLKDCPVRAYNEDGIEINDLARNLFPSTFPGHIHLPLRKMKRLHKDYDKHAIQLLMKADLRSHPWVQDLEKWVYEGLEREECLGLLRYLAENQRGLKDYYRIGQILQDKWFPGGASQMTTVEAYRDGLIPEEIVADPVYRAWLGIIPQPTAGAPPRKPEPRLHPGKALEKIYEWWHADGKLKIREYERQTYPDGKVPDLSVFSERSSRDRQNWLTLFLLGCTYTIGRTQPEQHRNFLQSCQERGWLNVFVDPDLQPDRWIKVLEDYLNEQVDESRFYNWMKMYINIFHIARWLPAYVDSFRAINQIRKPFSLDTVLQSRASALFQGGGVDAPPLNKALGIGACFVVRELVRQRVIDTPYVTPHCYVPVRRVRDLLSRIGCVELSDGIGGGLSNSRHIHEFLVKHLGSERATFGRSYDLPFAVLADDQDLQKLIFKQVIVTRSDNDYDE